MVGQKKQYWGRDANPQKDPLGTGMGSEGKHGGNREKHEKDRGKNRGMRRTRALCGKNKRFGGMTQDEWG